MSRKTFISRNQNSIFQLRLSPKNIICYSLLFSSTNIGNIVTQFSKIYYGHPRDVFVNNDLHETFSMISSEVIFSSASDAA